MGAHLEFTGSVPRENGRLAARIANKIAQASDLEFKHSDLTPAEVATILAGAGKLVSVVSAGHPLIPEALRALASQDKLQTFRWADAGSVADADGQHFQDMRLLRVFSLGNADFTTAFAEPLGHCRHLWQVSLHDCLVDDGIAQALAGLSELRVLSLQRSFVTGATLGLLKNTQLAELHLDGCDVDGQGLGESLSSLLALKVISLEGTPFSDEHIHYLIGKPHLTTLRLGGTRITDQALGFFEYLPQKTTVQVGGTAVTAEGLGRLRAKRPDLLMS